MEKYPADAADFMAMFPTDDACADYLIRVRWPGGYICPRCSSKDHWKKARGLFACRSCGHEGSVTAGTLFQGTRKPLCLWFQAMWYVMNQKNGVSALGMQKALGLKTYQTAWEWLHKLRRAMVRPGREKLSGVVEVNEAFIGGERTGKRGRGAEGKSLIFIAAEDAGGRIGRIRITMLTDASGDALTKAVQETIEAGSRIRTDDWNGYNFLARHGYKHTAAAHKKTETGDATPLAHLVASLFKRWWLGTHQGAISPENLRYYLDEFTFRFNRRKSKSRGLLFYRLIEGALATAPAPAKTLKINI
jgi:transposase-like protein